MYRVEWNRGPDRRQERDQRQREDSRDREAEIERRRKEREKRHAEREARDDERNGKRRRSRSPARPPSEEGEIAGPPNSDDLDYIRAKQQKKQTSDDPLSMKTGGAYIPPARLRLMQQSIKDKASAEFQRLAWEALKKSINGHINKVNVTNIGAIVRELLAENIVRGRCVL